LTHLFDRVSGARIVAPNEAETWREVAERASTMAENTLPKARAFHVALRPRHAYHDGKDDPAQSAIAHGEPFAGKQRIAIVAALGNLRSPAPFGGLIDHDHEGAGGRDKGGDRQQQQTAAEGQGHPTGAIEDLMEAGKVGTVAVAGEA
jgi:hypothetical protein